MLKIGYAKVPSKAEPITPQQALAQPAILASLAAGAIERINTTSVWNKNPINNRPVTNEVSIKESEQNATYGGIKESHVDIYLPIASIPESTLYKKFDTVKLRDIRKSLEGNISTSELDNIFNAIVQESIDLCSGTYLLIVDYIGNVIVQKLMEKCSEAQKLQVIEIVGPSLASLCVHKNGTWAVQKIIDCAKTTAQIESIVKSLKVYVPALLLDQFGNYVIQCC